MEPTPRSLIVDLLATAKEARLPVRALITAGQVFAFSSNRMRVALCRLRERGTVWSPARGEYALSVGAQRRNRRVRAWREPRALTRWREDFVAAVGAPEHARRWLELLGYRTLRQGTWLRPNNLRGGVAGQRAELREMGIEEPVVARVTDLPERELAALLERWDATAIAEAHREMTERLERSADALDGMEVHAALRETFTLGGEAIRRLVLDPRLPAALADPEPRRRLTAAMRDYDRLGRARWRALLETSPSQAPSDGLAIRQAYRGAVA